MILELNMIKYARIICLILASIAVQARASPPDGAASTNYWKRFLAGIESDDFKKQGDILLSYVWDGPPNDSAAPPLIATQAVTRLVELGQIYSSTNWVFGTNVPAKMVLVGFIVSAIPQMGPPATNALPWLEKMLITSDAPENLKVQIFFSISSIAPNSEVEWRAISYCLHSRQDKLFVTGTERFSHVSPYRRSADFIPLLRELLRKQDQSPVQKAATIRAFGYIGSAFNMILQETDLKYRTRWAEVYAQVLSPDDVKIIGYLLFDPSIQVQEVAVSVLDQIGTNAVPAKAALQQAKANGDAEMKKKATEILNHL